MVTVHLVPLYSLLFLTIGGGGGLGGCGFNRLLRPFLLWRFLRQEILAVAPPHTALLPYILGFSSGARVGPYARGTTSVRVHTVVPLHCLWSLWLRPFVKEVTVQTIQAAFVPFVRSLLSTFLAFIMACRLTRATARPRPVPLLAVGPDPHMLYSSYSRFAPPCISQAPILTPATLGTVNGRICFLAVSEL